MVAEKGQPLLMLVVEFPYFCIFRVGCKHFDATLFCTTELVLSSVPVFDDACFIRLCVFAFCSNCSMKLRSASFTNCFLNVRSDQDSFTLAAKFKLPC